MQKAVKAPFTKGVNFTNWLEYRPASEVKEDYYTKQDFINAKRLGCDVIRLPIHFEELIAGDKSLTIPEKVFRILDRVAEWVNELQMHVIFDFHNATGADSRTSDDVESLLIPIWSQVAARYKDASDYIIYELMNEPHGIEIEKWNKAIYNVFHHVRAIDEKHHIIVGGADWNSFAAMKTLPDFQDDKVIYTFHFYDPHTFTHQGAGWSHLERVVGIPFPYEESRMPQMPENPTEEERRRFENYPKEGTVERVIEFFDQYVAFSVERNAPVFCGEFGAFAPFATHEDRVSWYTIVANLLDERGIARTSWDYYGGFGIYDFRKLKGLTMEERRKWTWDFPEDLDMDIVKALKLGDSL